ncbi:MAG TPA: hypothetical protein VH063_17455 [Gaiellaceae bacterium]|jgi:hypothetical protein|nr:hypothetical protein [Gaiellaceae bacterium]
MLGLGKDHVLTSGVQAAAVVTAVDYAHVLGMEIAQNYNYKLDLTLIVRPENEAPFEAHIKGYFSQFAQPCIGDQMWVRYDPKDTTHVEVDEARIAADNAAAESAIAATAMSSVPADLVNGILGRAGLVDVQKTPVGAMVDCTVTVGVRLVDGSNPYRTSCHALVTPDQAEHLIPGSTFLTIRADPNDHTRIALSLNEETPVVTITDPAVLGPPVQSLADGAPCRAVVLLHQRQWLKTPAGDEFYAVKVKVTADNSEFQVNIPVPAAATGLLQDGAELPAKRLAAEPNVLMIDWAAAQAEHPAAGAAAGPSS